MKSAPPIAPPGCPDLAFSTMAAERMRILSAARLVTLLCMLLGGDYWIPATIIKRNGPGLLV